MNEPKNSKNLNKISAAIEAILFVYGEPLSVGKIAKILAKDKDFGKIKKEEIEAAVQKLEDDLKNENRGLTLIFSDTAEGKEIQLATKSEFSALLEEFIKDEFKESLTPASLEALGLVAYLGPLSRLQIDYYRGVNSSFILRSLLIRGLVSRYPDPQRNNVYLYQASSDLIKYLGLSRIEELPEYQKFKTMTNNQQPQTNN
jgi:segregation and condensation protein B